MRNMMLLKKNLLMAILSFKATSIYTKWIQIILINCILPIVHISFFLLILQKTKNIELKNQDLILNNVIYFGFLNNSVYLVNSINLEKSYGTLPQLVIASTSVYVSFIIKMIVPFIITTMSQFILILAMYMARIIFVNIGGILVIIVVSNICFSIYGICLGIVLLPSTKAHIYVNILSLFLMFSSGINFPLERLPFLLRKLTYCFPLIYARNAILLGSRKIIFSIYDILVLLTFAIIYLIISIVFSNKMENKLRMKNLYF